MKRRAAVPVGASILLMLLLASCAKNFVITERLDKPLDRPASFVVGEITDGLPEDMPEGMKPSLEDINKLKSFFHSELLRRKFISQSLAGKEGVEYKVVGRLVEFWKERGIFQTVNGFGLGDAKTSIEMKLVDPATNEVIFAGMFKANVSDRADANDKMFRKVAKDFSKELEKQMKKLSKS